MPNLLIQQNYLSYRGVFSSPALSLWGNGARIMGGLLGAFEPFGATLGGVSVDEVTSRPADQRIGLILPGGVGYTFRLEGVEAEIRDFEAQVLPDFAEFLSKGDGWLRDEVSDLGYSSHLFSYASHSALDGDEDSSSFLASITDVSLPRLGRNRGTGLILHADSDDGKTRYQLTLDHSLMVEGGLFLQFVVIKTQDQIDFNGVLEHVTQELGVALEQFGLRMEGVTSE